MQLNMFYNANQKVKGTNSTYRIEGIKTGKRQRFLKEVKNQGLQSYDERVQLKKGGKKNRKIETEQRSYRQREGVDSSRKHKNVKYMMLIQGSTNLIFACIDFRARKMVLHARLCTQNLRVYNTLTVGANLYRLIYNLLITIVFPTYFAIS